MTVFVLTHLQRRRNAIRRPPDPPIVRVSLIRFDDKGEPINADREGQLAVYYHFGNFWDPVKRATIRFSL